jgi:hypothetical protein
MEPEMLPPVAARKEAAANTRNATASRERLFLGAQAVEIEFCWNKWPHSSYRETDHKDSAKAKRLRAVHLWRKIKE